MTTKIQIKDYLAKWLYVSRSGSDFSKPIKFDHNEYIWHLILDLVNLRPKTAPLIDKGNVEILLPYPKKGKDPRYYNYISETASTEIAHQLKKMFYFEARNFIDDNRKKGINIKESAFLFIEKYQIENNLSSDAIIKNYYRNKILLKKLARI